MDKKYRLRYLPFFEQDLASARDYIAFDLMNPTAALRLVEDTEKAILKRLKNPLHYIDPLGLDSFVFYDPNMFSVTEAKTYADSMKKDLDEKFGTPTHLIEVTTVDKFTTEWDKMHENGPIDAVVILGHSGPGLFDFDMSDPRTQRLDSPAINNLTPQEIAMLILLGCNTAHSNVPDNIASLFFANNDIAKMIASDGTTYHSIDENGVYRIFSISDEIWARYNDLVGQVSANSSNLNDIKDLKKLLSELSDYTALNFGFLLYHQGIINPTELGFDVTFAELIACD